MATIDDLLKATLAHRAQDGQSSRRDKIEALEAKIGETSGKLTQGGLSSVLKIFTDMVGSSGHGQKGLKLLAPYLGIAALANAAFSGISTNRDLHAKLDALRGSGQNDGPSMRPPV